MQHLQLILNFSAHQELCAIAKAINAVLGGFAVLAFQEIRVDIGIHWKHVYKTKKWRKNKHKRTSKSRRNR